MVHIKLNPKRFIAWVLTFAMLFTTLPVTAFAEALNFNAPGFNQAIVDELQKLCGDKYEAQEILQTMYDAGFIDKNGNLILGDTFIVNGTEYTTAELEAEAPKHLPGEPVIIDGTAGTWGDIQELLRLREVYALIDECVNSDATITQEHIDMLGSLYSQIMSEGISLSNLSVGDNSPVYKIYCTFADGKYTIDPTKTESFTGQTGLIGKLGLSTEAGAYSFDDANRTQDGDHYYFEIYTNPATSGGAGEEDPDDPDDPPDPATWMEQKNVAANAPVMRIIPKTYLTYYHGSNNYRDGYADPSGAAYSAHNYYVMTDHGNTCSEISVPTTRGSRYVVLSVSFDKVPTAPITFQYRFNTEDSTTGHFFAKEDQWIAGNGDLTRFGQLNTAIFDTTLQGFLDNIAIKNTDNVSNLIEISKRDKITGETSYTANIDGGGTRTVPYTLGKDALYVVGIKDEVQGMQPNPTTDAQAFKYVGLAYDYTKHYDEDPGRIRTITITPEAEKTEYEFAVVFTGMDQTYPVGRSITRYANEEGGFKYGGGGAVMQFDYRVVEGAIMSPVTLDLKNLQNGAVGTTTSPGSAYYTYKPAAGNKGIMALPIIAPTKSISATTGITPTATIKSGSYQSGDLIPITVEFSSYVNTPNVGTASIPNGNVAAQVVGLEIEVNGTWIKSLEYGQVKKATFLYPVKATDTGTVKVTGIRHANTAYSFLDTNFAKENAECKISSEFTAFMDGMTTVHNKDNSMAVSEIALKTDDTSLNAITAAKSATAESVTLYDKDGTAHTDSYFYLKNMYASMDGGATKHKVYIIADMLTQAQTPEKLLVNIALPGNAGVGSDKTYRMDTVNIFRDNNTSKDIVDSATEKGGLVTDSKYIGQLLVPPSVTFEDGDIEINYGGVWNHYAGSTGDDASFYFEDLDQYCGGIEPSSEDPNHIGFYDDSLYLSYSIADDKNYSFAGADNFVWTSGDESIATVETKDVDFTFNSKNVKKRIAVITPTGLGGEVTFTLTNTNGGGTPVVVDSATLTVKEGGKLYLTIPKSSQTRMTKKNEAVDVLFVSNITGISDAPVTYELKLYNIDESGKKTGAAIYTGSVVSTKEAVKNSITIPESTLSKVSSKTVGYSYIAEISAEYDNEPFNAEAKITVLPAPVKVSIDNNNAYNYHTDDTALNLSWTIDNLETGATTGYELIRNSTGEVIKKGAANASGSITIPASELKIASGLKDIYILRVVGQNADDAYESMDSVVIFVYNSTALDIVVEEIGGITYDGNTVTMNNEPRVRTMAEGGKSVDFAKYDFTLNELRKDLNLASVISINYGSGTWGMISDVIKWEPSRTDNDSPFFVNYLQGGFYSPIQTYVYEHYLPETDFLLTGRKDGGGTVTAIHANTGMEKTVDVNVSMLNDKVYMFKSIPAIKSTLTYTNGLNQVVKVDTNDNGELVLYEENGIISDIHALSKTGEVYIGSIRKEFIYSGERDVTLLQDFSLNTLRMFKVSDVVINIRKPDGKPLASTDVTIRGGVYKNGYYCPDAMFNYTGGTTADQPGRDDGTVRTDSKGNALIKLDPSQFYIYNYGEEMMAGDKYTYVFELRFGGSYNPVFVTVDPAFANGQSPTAGGSVQLSNVQAPAYKPFMYSQTYYNSNPEPFDLFYARDNVGASNKFDDCVIYTDGMLWGYETTKAANDYNIYESGTVFTVRFEDTNGGYSGGQTEPTAPVMVDDLRKKENAAIYYYPFSSMPAYKHEYRLNYEAFGGTKSGNSYDWSNAWIKSDESKAVNFVYYANDIELRKQPMAYRIENTIGKEDAVKSVSMNKAAGDAADQITDELDIGSVFGSLVPGGDMLATAMTFFSGVASQGEYTVNMMTFPTVDPSTFKIVVSVGEPVGEGEQEEPEGDVSLQYPTDNDYDEFAESMEEVGNWLSGEEGDDDDDDGGMEGSVKFSYSGAMTALATYDAKTEKWSFALIGGNISATVKVKASYGTNFLCGPIPVTISFEAGASLGAGFGAQSRILSGDFATDFLITVKAKAYVEAFAGIGFDFSVVALKLGIFGNISADVQAKFLTLTTLQEPYVDMKFGTQLGIKGEIGIKLVVKIVFIKYEKTFASVGFSWTKQYGQYNNITNYWQGGGKNPYGGASARMWNSDDFVVTQWTGTTLEGDEYEATLFGSGEVLYSIGGEALEDRDYLDMYTRTWSSGASGRMSPMSIDVTNKLENIQTNAYPYSNPLLSDDGQMMLYLSDADSGDIEETVVSYATVDGAVYTNKGAVAKITGDTKATYGYGDSNHTLSGSGSNYFAAWVRQKESLGDANIAAMMDSTEIMAAVYSGGQWVRHELTDNSNPDLAPSIASSGNKAITAWRSTASSSSEASQENPLNFNISDTIVFSIYNGTSWSKESVAYNGSNGTVQALETAMMADGTAIIAYTVKADDSTETFYTVLDSDGEALQTVRMTNDTFTDENVQVKTIKDGNAEKFILGWYRQDDKGTSDIRLAAIKDDGLMDVNFIESLSDSGAKGITNNFRFAVKNGGGLTDLAIVWSERAANDGSDDFAEHGYINAVKFYNESGVIGVTTPQEVAKTADYTMIDHFDSYMGSDGKLYAAILVSDYSNIGIDQIGNVYNAPLQDAVIAIHGERTEANAVAWDAMMEAAREEQQKDTIAILEQTPESKMLSATAEFKDSIKLNAPVVPISEIIRGTEIPVTFAVKNTGISKITAVTAVIGSETKTFSGISILPSQTQSFTMYYPIAMDAVSDPTYTISATAGSGTLTKNGKLILNLPDIGLRDIKIVSEQDGKRKIQATLYNNSDIPLVDSGKTAKIAFYSSQNYEESDLLGSVDTINTGDLEMIDYGTYIYEAEIDVAELMSKQYDAGDIENNEVPDHGLFVYAKAWLQDGSDIFNEVRKMNNEKYITFKGLLTKSQGEQFTLSNSMDIDDEGNVDVILEAKNNSMNSMVIQNILVTLFDAEGNIVGTAITYDGTDTSYINVGREGVVSEDLTISAEDITGEVYSSKVEITGTEVEVTFDWGELTNEEEPVPYEEKTIKIGSAVVAPEDEPSFANYKFEGWFTDEECEVAFDFTKKIYYDTTIYAGWDADLKASVADVTVSGERLSPIDATDITITMTGDTFKDLNIGDPVSSWFTNLYGLSAAVKELTDDNTVVITLSGTPNAKASGALAIKIPAVNRTLGIIGTINDLTVKANANAKFAITGTTLTLNETEQSVVYTGETKAFVIDELNDYAEAGYTVSYEQGSVSATPITAGTYDVVITRAEDDDYAAYSATIEGGLVITKAEASVSVAASLDEAVYGDDVVLTATVKGITQPTGSVQFYIEENEFGNEQSINEFGLASITLVSPSALTYTYKAEYSGDDNFKSQMSTESQFSVDKDTFTKDTDYSTSGATVTYDGQDHKITVAVMNKAQNALVEYSIDEEAYSSTPLTFKNAGTYTVHYKITKDNWNEVKGSEQVIINKRVVDLDWSGYDTRVYDGTASNVTATVTNMAQGDTSVTVTVANGTQANVGAYTAEITAVSDSNYSLPTTVTKDYEITKRPVTITVNPAEKIVDSPDPAFTFRVDGAISGSEDVIVTLARIEGETKGNYAIVMVGDVNANYDVTFMGNYLTIKEQANDPIPTLYTVSGTVANNGTEGDVTVTIMQGNKIFGTSIGETYSFANLAAGAYNITATNGTESKTSYVELTATTVVDITIGTKSAEVIVNGDETPPVVVSVLALEDELKDVATSLKIVVDTKETPDKIATMAEAAGQKIAFNLDFTVLKDDARQSTYEFNNIIKVTFPIPDAAKGRLITVYRLHGSIASAMPVGVGNAINGGEYVEIGTDMITFYVNKFSDYAVGYSAATQTITASAGAGGTISPTGAVTVTTGEDQTFTIAAKSDYSISDVKVDGVSVGKVSTYTFEYVTASHTISATFSYNGGSGGGGGSGNSYATVSFDANGASGDQASQSVVRYGNYTLPTNPFTYSGYNFTGWKIDNKGDTLSVGTSITVNNSIKLYAQWELASTKITETPTTETPATETPATDKLEDSDVSRLLNTDDHVAYMNGRSNDMFAANENMTRAEVAQMFYNMLRDKNVTITKNFADVSSDVWYAKAVNTLASLGIINGYPDGGFHPNNNITRAEFAAIAVKFAKVSQGSKNFDDAMSTHWAYQYINTAANFGWVTGVGNNRFDPDRNITRAEAATLFNRMLKRYPDKAYIDANPDLNRFADVDKKHWAYYEIMEAAITHNYKKDGKAETWQ